MNLQELRQRAIEGPLGREAVLNLIDDHADACKRIEELERELTSTLGRAKNAESIMVANGEKADRLKKLLLHLVDVVWADAMEDGQVPSTDHARKLIAHAEATVESVQEESHVLPFSVMLRNEEGEWQQQGVHATREEADAAAHQYLAKRGLQCPPIRVADTRRVLKHVGPIMNFKGIEPQ